MTNNIVSKTGNFISDNKKPLLYIGGALAVVIIGYVIVKRVTGGVKGLLKDNAKRDTAFKNVEVDDSKATISDSVANNYANQLYNAMRDTGTNSSMITNVLSKLQKKDDFRKVYNAFGKRSYANYFPAGGGESTFLTQWSASDKDLIEWFDEEVGYSNYPTYSLVQKTVNNAGFAF